MHPQTWQRTQKLFLAVADLDPYEREAILAGTPDLRAEVEALLKADTGSEEYIANAVQSAANSLLDSPQHYERIGPYRILRQIGQGGMGAVFLATRDDDHYQKQVAIKVVLRGMGSAEVLARFRHERQILANLDHPFIARLFDGGATADGLPYFVMEFVEGHIVDEFCRVKALNIDARLRLFADICQAVACAHRNLVIHQDLKPANIIVTSTGTPKLLDFGIARLVTADAGEPGEQVRGFTPGYASPEQVRGEPITTAADVYALGAVLFELLTEQPVQPLPPSLLAPELNADLDSIVLMAMANDPRQRYQSADLLAADIHRYLNGDAVLARNGSTLYRAGKFLLRNRWNTAAAFAVAASLIAATIISTIQYQRAERERISAVSGRALAEVESKVAEKARQDEAEARHIAEEQRATAEQRLSELTNLANQTLFEVDTAVAPLPGALAARKLIVTTTLNYLERLEKTAAGNASIRLPLSAAYYKIGIIQGGTYAPSLQDFTGAQASLSKAKALLAPIYLAHPDDPETLLRWVQIEDGLAEILYRTGHINASKAVYQAVIPRAHLLAQLRPNELLSAKPEAVQNLRLSQVIHRDEPAKSLELSQHGVSLLRALIARFPNDRVLKEEYAMGLTEVASTFVQIHELDRSAELFRQSIEMREEMLLADPHNVGLRRNLIVANGNYSVILGVPWSTNLGRLPEARAAASKAVAYARTLVSADPLDANSRFDLSMCLSRLGSIEPEAGRAAESVGFMKEAIALMEAAYKANPTSRPIPDQLSVAYEFAGHRLESIGQIEEAARSYKASLAYTAIKSESTSTNWRAMLQSMNDNEALAILYARKGDRPQAIERAQMALASAKIFGAAQADEHRAAHLAHAWYATAYVHSMFQEWPQARNAAQQALALLQPIHDKYILALHKSAIDGATAILSHSENGQPALR